MFFVFWHSIGASSFPVSCPLERIAHGFVDGRPAFEASPWAGPAGVADPENRPQAGQQCQDQVWQMVDSLPADRDLLQTPAAVAAGFLKSTESQYRNHRRDPTVDIVPDSKRSPV
jgi:hypothetical protein